MILQGFLSSLGVTKKAHVFVTIADGGHLNSIRSISNACRRQNRYCLPPTDNRQNQALGAAVLA
jgi:hypothetical protein